MLDAPINSMTEFKQIIGRGTRLRPDFGKTHFTIMDFRGVTEKFLDPEFDGDPVQDEEWPKERAAGDPPDDPPERPEPDDEAHRPVRYVIDDVPVEIIRERVQYYDPHGNLITKSFTEYSREKALAEFAGRSMRVWAHGRPPSARRRSSSS